ncbi:PREDICTED: F-box protein At3g26010-like [Brassica oleracea var. oleracea]|uniref:F-box protein At3g26010-like n=1 Tax=Brassica oleracea var. oleracea TaxID=109376 RepID=UPI0006A7536D|nr:PREDICTED: F-box protein At3g26010-like [Brassica oleracea var. oleracea]
MAMETQTHLIEAMLTEVLARLPLRSIARFKTVCKTWKTTLESTYFRRLFVSAHRNSSSSWSLVFVSKEIIGFHGCETWDLPKSPASFIPPSLKRFIFGYLSYACSSGLVLLKDSSYSNESYCYVGNPVLKQWIRIPPAPSYSVVLGLVTRLDEDGVVSSFKVIRIASVQSTNNDLACIWRVFIYSSEIGIWSFKKIYSPHHIQNMYYYITLNGTIYISCVSVHGVVLLSHDFYSESNEFRVVKLPEYQSDKKGIRRSLTTSGGFIMYVTAFYQTEDDVLKIWRLNDDDESWKLLWVIKLPSISVYVPMAMHPFDIGTVYLCSHHDRHLVSCNLRTLNYTILKDGYQDCFIDQSVCDSFVNGVSDPRSSSYWWNGVSVKFLPLVLPRWMGSVPCPPQAEMIDTVSLLSYMTSTERTMKKEKSQRQ